MSNAYSPYPGASIDIFSARVLVAPQVSCIHDFEARRNTEAEEQRS
jgi:hypothetical protein